MAGGSDYGGCDLGALKRSALSGSLAIACIVVFQNSPAQHKWLQHCGEQPQSCHPNFLFAVRISHIAVSSNTYRYAT